MSFSSKVKRELSRMEAISPCCLHAQIYGMLLFGRAFSANGISLSTENEAVVKIYIDGIYKLTGIKPKMLNKGGRKTTVGVIAKNDCITILEKFSHSKKELTLRINRANLADECCLAAFLRGVFLSCGIITTPEKNYHLEFVVSRTKLCNDFMKFMQEFNLNPKHTKRKNSNVLYFKDSTSIEDVLTVMGAMNSSLELMGIKIHKDMRNRVNRRVNFETANITRTVIAASTQVKAIESIISKKGIDFLTPSLREVAVLRVEYPEATLRELGQMLSESVSRSGVNHRLNKIIEIANNL
ncbi:MAG TPA: DNA-binding protein WhiA [Clostridia bacterium]|nr:DNA-binding protein WhiA [Clostridia bacterium]